MSTNSWHFKSKLNIDHVPKSSSRANSEFLASIAGNYTCEVEWIGSPISITHKLTVLVPPSIVAVLPGGMGQVDHPIEAREGSQVRLECRAEGIPPPIVRWRSPVSTSFHYVDVTHMHSMSKWSKCNRWRQVAFGHLKITAIMTHF